jgi:hypothetical protein
MAYCRHGTPTSPGTVTLRLRELARAAQSAVNAPRPTSDPDDVIGPIEAVLDLIAEALDGDALCCAACQEPLAAFRVREWTTVVSGKLCTDQLCSSCYSTREDVEDEARDYFSTV